MINAIIKAVSLETGKVHFYSGKAGAGWLCEDEADAFVYGFEAAQRMAETFRRGMWGATTRFYAIQLPHNYTVCIYRGSSNWDCYLTDSGWLQSVPNEEGRQAGCAESYYGNREHLLKLMREGYFCEYEGFTEAGLEYMAGLYCGGRSSAPRIQFTTQGVAAA